MLTPAARARTMLIATVREPGPSIAVWARHHLAIGVDRIMVFFDDPRDPAIDHLPADDRVSAVACDAEHRACWAEWPDLRARADEEVMARQMLNAELALLVARAEGYDWLVHLDGDELLDCCGDLAVVLAGATEAQIEQLTFWNWEGVPERLELPDPFQDVTLFKRNPACLGPDELAVTRAVAARLPQVPARWFHYYRNGKSAVRVLPGVRPSGCHGFERRSAPLRTEATASPRVLHYANPGFAAFLHRYRMWGAFPDRWFGAALIRDQIGDFHVEARDVVASGDLERARAFYRSRAVLDDAAEADALVAAGLCDRIAGLASVTTPVSP